MQIEKVKAILTKANVSAELAKAICESMEQFKQNVTEQAKTELTNKIRAAKKVVLEEVETYKTDLAKRVQLFCESKGSTIEQQLMRRSAAGEAEATTRLKKVHALLEGVELDGKPNSEVMAQIADAQATIGKLTQKMKVIESKAQRSVQVAESVLAQNKALITENKKLKNGQTIVVENVKAKPSQQLVVPAKTKIAQAPTVQVHKPIFESKTPTNIDVITQIAENM